jgi:predicted PurR-regulated permease PerM
MTESLPDPLRFRKRFVLVLVFLVTALFVYMIQGFIVALILAAVFGALMRPVYLWWHERFGQRPAIASGVTIGISITAIVIPMLFLIGLLVEQAQTVVNNLSPWVEQQIEQQGKSEQPLPDWVPAREIIEPYRATISTKLAEFASSIGGWLVGSLSAATQGTASFFLSLFIMLYAMFFYLISGPETIRKAMHFLPLAPADSDRILEVGRSVSLATIRGTIIIGAIQGILGGIALAIAGVPGAAFWGALMAVMSVIPGIGPSIVWGPIVIYLLIKGETLTALLLLAWNGGVVGTIDNILRPMLVGKDTQMPDLLILLSTLGGLTLFGAAGLIIGPVVAGLCITCWTIYGQVFHEWLNDPDDAEKKIEAGS